MNKNYLDKIPCHNVLWTVDHSLVTLEVKNKGILKKITQKFLKKAEISYIHLDRFGSFIWQKIDGNVSVFEIGKSVSKEFGDVAEPVYGRLTKFLDTLKSYNFITWKL